MLRVTDTGRGLSEEAQAHLFEPFFTTEGMARRAGMGLASVYGMVRQAGGAVDVAPAPAGGTMVTIYLPRYRGVGDVADADQAGPAPVAGRDVALLLLVEDEDALRALAVEVLETEGYKVLAVRNASEALAQAEAQSGPIHLLITDVVLPGQGGRELAERLTAVRPALRVLFMSGYPSDIVLRDGVSDSTVAFLPKPFTPDQLRQAVREALAAPASA